MEKITILVDSDGVLADLVTKWCAAYNAEYNDNLAIEDFNKDFDGVHEVVKPECGEKVYDIMKVPGMFSDLDFVDGALEGIKWLCNNKELDVYIVTSFSGCGEIAKGKMDWFEKKLSFLDPEQIILCKRKEIVDGDVLIDDSVENLENWAKHQTELGKDSSHAIALAAPHNVEADENPLIDFRAETWDDIINYLENIVLS